MASARRYADSTHGIITDTHKEVILLGWTESL